MEKKRGNEKKFMKFYFHEKIERKKSGNEGRN